MSSEELPEHQIFHVLRNGEQEPIGPYSQNQLVELLNQSLIRSTDYVYYPEMTGWKPLSQVFDLHQQITNFGDDGQDPQVVSDTFELMTRRAEPDEEIYYIGVQHFPALSLSAAVKLTSPKSIVLTNRRFCVIHPKLIGDVELVEYPISQVESGVKRIKGNDDKGVFNIVLKSGEWIETDKIPANQLRRMEELAATLLP